MCRSDNVELDEIWSFVGSKERTRKRLSKPVGSRGDTDDLTGAEGQKNREGPPGDGLTREPVRLQLAIAAWDERADGSWARGRAPAFGRIRNFKWLGS
jgi:hypothetical protein